jgi:cysteine desulfurase
MIYLDYNARAPLLPTARQAMIEALDLVGNPSSVHTAGRFIRKALESARNQIAEYIGASPAEVVFTSGASEANTQVVQTFRVLGADIFISAIEHDSVRQAAPEAIQIPVKSTGVLDILALESLLQRSSSPLLAVSVMAANNETGVLQPLREVVEIVKKYGGVIHVDASQAVGRIPVHFKEWGIDYLTFSSHKLGGPMGAGAVIVREGCPLEPLVWGGGQEKNRRAGTQNVPAIIGFAAAVQEMKPVNWQPIEILRDDMEKEIQLIAKEVHIFGKGSPRLPNTSCLSMPGVENETQVIAFDLAGIAVSAGAACSSGKVTPSTVLKAMGFSTQTVREAIRVSLSPQTCRQEIKAFVTTWGRIYHQAHIHRSPLAPAIEERGVCQP